MQMPSSQTGEAIPEDIRWQDVRMLSIEERAVTILLKGEDAPKVYRFSTREEKEAVLEKWFAGRWSEKDAYARNSGLSRE